MGLLQSFFNMIACPPLSKLMIFSIILFKLFPLDLHKTPISDTMLSTCKEIDGYIEKIY